LLQGEWGPNLTMVLVIFTKCFPDTAVNIW